MDFIPGIDGPSEGVPRVLACFSNNLLRREPLKLVDGGQSQRTFVYIKDAIEAVLLMIENPARANGHIFNVGNPNNEVTVRQLAEMMTQVSLILRGANDYMLDEMERALHDSLCIIKRTLESNTVVAGGGAVEAALSVYLEYLATTLGSREQLAIAEFAESLLIIPKILAVNAAKDATELVAKLRAYHHIAQTKPDKKHLSSMGLDLLKGTVRNNLEAGVIEPAMSKVKIIQFATEAAITILRIDDVGDIIFE